MKYGYVPGEQIDLEVLVKNDSRRQIECIEINLLKNVTFTATGNPGTRQKYEIFDIFHDCKVSQSKEP